MTITYRKKVACFQEVVGVDEAEGLLEWILKRPGASIDLSACAHMHPANLQVLMAARPLIAAWPEAQDLRSWVEPVLNS